MDLSNISLWEIAKGGWMAAAGIVAWIGQKHMAHDSKIHDKVFERLTELDQTIVTKAELQRIDDKLDTILLHMAQR